METDYLDFLREAKTVTDNISIKMVNPKQIIDEFISLWMDHINYVNKIQNFPYLKATPQLAKQKLERALKIFPKAHVLFTARDEDKLIGYVQVGMKVKHGQLISFHLLEKYRRGGIGSRLISDALKWLWQNGAKEIELGTQGGNEDAVGFYKRHGFEIQGYTLRHKKSKY